MKAVYYVYIGNFNIGRPNSIFKLARVYVLQGFFFPFWNGLFVAMFACCPRKSFLCLVVFFLCFRLSSRPVIIIIMIISVVL